MELSLIEDFSKFENLQVGYLITLIKEGRVFHYIFLGIHPNEKKSKTIIVENLYNIEKCKLQKINYDNDKSKQVWYIGKLDFNSEVINNHHLIQNKTKLFELKGLLDNAKRNDDIVFVKDYEAMKRLENDEVITVINCRGIKHYKTVKTSDNRFFLANFDIFKKNGDVLWEKMWKFSNYKIFRDNSGYYGSHPLYAYNDVIIKGYYNQMDFELIKIRIFQIQSEIAFSMRLNEASDIQFHNLLNSISSKYV